MRAGSSSSVVMLIVLACACLCVFVLGWLCSVVLTCAWLSCSVIVLHGPPQSLCWFVLGGVLGCVHPPSACCAHLLCLNPFQVSNPHTANQASGCPKQLSTRCLAAASLHPSVPKSHPQTHTQADRSRFASLLTTSHPHRI